MSGHMHIFNILYFDGEGIELGRCDCGAFLLVDDQADLTYIEVDNKTTRAERERIMAEKGF